MKEMKMGMGRRMEDGREWRLPGLLYADDLILCGELEEDLRVMVKRFAEMCRKRGLKKSGGKSKAIAMNGGEGLECEVHIDGIRLEHVSKFKYLGCVLDKCVLCLFLCMTVRRCYGRRRRDLKLWLCRWTTSEDC